MKFRKISRLIALFLASIVVIGAVPISKTQAAEVTKQIVSVAFPRPSDNTTSGTDTWGHSTLKYQNGSVHQASKFTNMQYIESDTDAICYCIEPGKHVSDGSSYTQRGEDYFNRIPANRILNNSEIQKGIGRIFQYGYSGTVDDDWVSQNSTHANNMANAIATQLLIWEVVVGERDKDFKYVAPDSGYNKVLDSLNSAHPLRSKVMNHYNRIVSSLKNHTGSPSFMSQDSNEAITKEMKWNGNEYKIELTDTNNVLTKFSFVPDNSNVKVTVSGNRLILSSKYAVSNVRITAKKNGTQVRSGIVVWEAPSGQQTVATYAAQVSDPISAYLNITSEQAKGTVKGLKVDPSGKPLEGATICLFGSTSSGNATNDAIQRVTTGADGKFEFTNIAFGEYFVKEMSAPKGYILNSTKYYVEITSAGAVIEIEIENVPEIGSVQIIKTSSDGVFYAQGIEFTLTGSNLNAPIKGKTDSKGCLTFSNLKPGTYTVTETVPDKYFPQDPQTVTVKPGEIATVSFANVVKIGTVKGLKVDHLGKPLAGAEIGLFTINTTSVVGNEAVQRMHTGTDGIFEFKNVPYGQYFVAELNPPEGYIKNTTKYYVDILENGAVVELKIENTPSSKVIEIIKVDADSNVLVGITFILERSSDNGLTWDIVKEATTDESGKVCFLSLIPGEFYRIMEIKTLDGYQLLAEPVFEGKLSVEDKSTITITISNTLEFELPPTGGNSFLYVPIGIGLAMGAVIVIYYLMKIERRGKEI